MAQALNNAMLAGKNVITMNKCQEKPLSNQTIEFVSSYQELLKQQGEELLWIKLQPKISKNCLVNELVYLKLMFKVKKVIA